jgi:hypothetical protein
LPSADNQGSRKADQQKTPGKSLLATTKASNLIENLRLKSLDPMPLEQNNDSFWCAVLLFPNQLTYSSVRIAKSFDLTKPLMLKAMFSSEVLAIQKTTVQMV